MKRDNSYLIGNTFAKGSKPNKTAFKKGMTPWNKGVKGLHFSPETEFKKGCKSLTKVPVGSMAIRARKNEKYKKRLFIKIAEPNKWIENSIFVWSEYYGKIIKNDVIHHMDGNTLNDNINNLIALPRTDHPLFHNRWWLIPLTMEQIDFYCSRYKSPPSASSTKRNN